MVATETIMPMPMLSRGKAANAWMWVYVATMCTPITSSTSHGAGTDRNTF